MHCNITQREVILTVSSNSEPELRSTRDVLQDKHPVGKSPNPLSLLTSSPEPDLFNPTIFENLDADTIHCAAMHTQGSAGPSGLDSICLEAIILLLWVSVP